MRKKIAVAYLAAFLLLFIAPSVIYGLFGVYFDQTNYEQRNAAEKPAFSIETIEAYPKAYEAYFDDNLPFRTQMIELNSLLDYGVFHQSPVNKVIIGNDGWLFYNPAGGDGDPIADYNGTNLYSEEQLSAMADNLMAARDSLREQGKEFVVYIAPNKECIYGEDYLPAQFVTDSGYTKGDQVAKYLWDNTDLTVVYPKEEILSAMENYPDHIFYYQTDTHWNALGAYIGAKELLDAVNIFVPDFDDLQITVGNEKIAGDLAGMMGLSKYLKYDLNYAVSGYAQGRAVTSSFLVEGDANNLISYSTTGADPRSMFVIRDSFSEAMMPYLSSQFDNCNFIHRSNFTVDLLQQYPSDIVVVQVVERYTDYLASFAAE